jgi:hypothetical protein
VISYWFFMIHGERLFEGKLQGFYTSRTVLGSDCATARDVARQSVQAEFGDFALHIEEERACEQNEYQSCPNKGAAWYEEEIEGSKH